MKLISRTMLVTLAALTLISTAIAFGQETDRAGYKDCPGISRVPGFILREYGDCVETAFDAHNFRVTENGKDTQKSVEGHKYYYRYRLKQGLPNSSELQVVRNYQNAARAVGGKILFDKNNITTIVLNKGGKELWLDVVPYHGTEYDLTIIEK